MASNDVLELASTWLAEGRKVALATVIETWGSAPQPIGSQLVIDSDGNFIGSVSGGCIEDDLIDRTHRLGMTQKAVEVVTYGVSADEARRFGLPCGGTLQLVAEPLTRESGMRALLREIAEYVFAVEAVTPPAATKQAILDRAHSNLFGLGPLEDLLCDETVTEISINGPAEVRFRRDGEPPRSAPHRFDNGTHLATILARLLVGSGAALSDATPFVEAGVTLRGRRARVSAIGPPLSPSPSVNLRLLIPDDICVVAESGICQRVDVDPLAEAGIDAILVGEALVSAEDVAAQVRNLSQ